MKSNHNRFLQLAQRQLFAKLLVVFTLTVLVGCDGESSSNVTQENIEVGNDSVVQTDADGTQVQCSENSEVIIDGVNVCSEEE